MARRCRCHPREHYLTCVECIICGHWSFDPWARACERRKCGWVEPDMVGRVRLTPEDRDRARACARQMVADARRVRAVDRLGKDEVAAHAHGALGEIAFAKFMDIPWECHSRDWAKADVAGYEVRAIPPRQKSVYLKAKPNDPEDRKVVLVLLLANYEDAMIVGWMTAGEIRSRSKLEDWGDRKAPANMLTDLRWLHYDFPEATWATRSSSSETSSSSSSGIATS